MRKSSIYARHEIIVSGGQWMSPQLLQLSGIGDQALLDQLGIETIQHLPGVGKNQQDRNEMPYIVKLKANPNLPGLIHPSCLLGTVLNHDCLFQSIGNATSDILTTNTLPFSIFVLLNPKQKTFRIVFCHLLHYDLLVLERTGY